VTDQPVPLRDLILVVDDTPETLGFLTQALEEAGFTALVATGGQKALALLEKITPDLILLDAMMPDMDGFETCRQLKAGNSRHVPVIFMTALNETEHIVRAFQAGGVDYLTKPIVLDELFARLRAHLSNARAAQSARMALDTSGSHLFSLGRAGDVRWSTPRADQLLRGLLAPDPAGRLPDPIRRDLVALAEKSDSGALVVAQPAGDRPLAFTYVGALNADDLLFRVAPHDARSDVEVLASQLQLTTREAEVLFWVARGKANRDIAEILDLSPRTVNKHLETIFAKLGVENRASAAVRATRALDERGSELKPF
jgi:DNA-binding NarL/FixJ family response regulator